ncbi:glycosyltransferase [Halanaerobacter jeridensis]|uniref:Glycosyl transferase family 1 domain-containing protein n=1 Tax=Halanaerobacter jeridensis TaxID=706427 RepID=A0A938XWH4_9FIRM|nr:glycosyltransferase [Halanaerobacter jeridensis]MBM7556922.1 hypothetical protein [Halanaerobacter jeridensis]
MNKKTIGFFLHGTGFGGYETRMFNLIKWLLENTEIKIIIFTNQLVLDHYKDRFSFLKRIKSRVEVNYCIANFDNSISKIFNAIKLNYLLLKKFNSFDVLIGAEYLKNAPWISKFKKTIINIVHPNFLGQESSINIIEKLIYRYLFKNANKIDFLNPYIYKKVFEKFNFLTKEYCSITPCSFINHSRKKLEDMNKKNRIMWMGSFEEQKQPMLLLKAVNEISNFLIKKEYKVKFYGKGPLENKMRSFIKKNNLDEIVTISFTKNTHKVIEEASIFVSSQKYTNYPSQVLLEAMDNYCIPIATDVPDTELLVTEKNGFLFNSLDELTENLTKIVEKDESKLKELRIKSHDIAANHNLDRYANHFIKLIS